MSYVIILRGRTPPEIGDFVERNGEPVGRITRADETGAYIGTMKVPFGAVPELREVWRIVRVNAPDGEMVASYMVFKDNEMESYR